MSFLATQAPWFHDEAAWKRAVALAGLLALATVVLFAASGLVGLSNGYGRAQYGTARWLAGHRSDWDAWRRATVRDLLAYIPIYVVFAAAAVLWVNPRGAGVPHAAWHHAVTVLSLGALVVTLAADVVETLLFRMTLTRLVQGVAVDQVSALTTVTRLMSATKVLAGMAVVVLLCIGVLRR